MKSYERSHLADGTLLHNAVVNTGKAREATADQIADIGEIEARGLHRPAGHGSMFKFCLHELHLSEQAAYRRIIVARKARRFPDIFHAIADGRLHLTAVVLLSRHLTQDNAADLLKAATHKTKAEIKILLAERFPQPDLPVVLEPIEPRPSPVLVATSPSQPLKLSPAIVPPSTLRLPVVPTGEPPAAHVMPLSPGRFGLQVTLGTETHDLLQRAHDLLGHRVPPGDVEAVLTLALRGLVQRLEQEKFAATDHPRPGRSRSADSRHIPADVQRAVWKRDGGRCAFLGATGHRCTETRDLQYDHIEPYARDGASTADNIRLLCRAHNQYAAEQAFGAEFMRRKRDAAREHAQDRQTRCFASSPCPASSASRRASASSPDRASS